MTNKELKQEVQSLRFHLAHAMIHSSDCDCTPENQAERQAQIASW